MSNQSRLFVASCVSLMTAAWVFIIRGDILDPLSTKFGADYQEIGTAAGISFLGIAVAVGLSGFLCDLVGMGPLLRLAAFLHIGGAILTIFAPSMQWLTVSTFTVGLAHGLVEGVINPLCATLYPKEKVHKLNVLHAWWPGGLVIGGLLAYVLTNLGVSWQVKQTMILLPALVYGAMVIGAKFPETERAASGVSYREMFKEALRPGFLFMALCMVLTAATELAPNQWMESVLRETAKMSGTMVLVYISSWMFVLRFFAGTLSRKISPIGILFGSAILSAIGLFLLSGATSVGSAYLSATVFAIGVCYFWPTMLGVVSERYPKGGALVIGLMGFVGMISVTNVVPIIGKIRDTHDAATSFRYVSVVPLALIILFGGLLVYYRSIGGYKQVRISGKR